MPFKPPFKNKYCFGDLIYGLKTKRNDYINNHAVFETLKKAPYVVSIIDHYAVTEIHKGKQERGCALIPENQDEFLQFLQSHSKYKSAYNPESFTVNLKDEEFYLIYTNSVETARKCKAGLDWAARFGKFKVHFFLDEINFADVISKSNSQDKMYDSVEDYLREQTAGIKKARLRSDYPKYSLTGKSITGSELRWIYRNRADKNVQRIIQFWYKYKTCCPPWEPDFDKVYGRPIAHLWLNYIPKYLESPTLLTREGGKFFTLASLFSCIKK